MLHLFAKLEDKGIYSMTENEYRCEGCGGIMQFDTASQMLKCPNCGNEMPIITENATVEEHPLTLDALRQNQVKDKPTQTMECSGCGAHIEVGKNETAARCPYCDSTYVLANKQEVTLVPDGVLPFKIDKQELSKLFATWIKKKWLAPNELKNIYQRGGFQGIYVPYWAFDAQTDCYYTAMGGKNRTEHYHDSEGKDCTRTVTDWYHTSGRIQHEFADVPVAASTRFHKGLFTGLEPFDFKQVTPYSADYTSGYLSENYSIGLEEGHRDGISQMEQELRNMAANQVRRRYDTVKDIRLNTRYYNEAYKYIMLPIYSTAYSYKDKNYTVLINGQSGKVKGKYPKSPIKIAIIAIVAIIIIALVAIFGNKNKQDRACVEDRTEQEIVCIQDDNSICIEVNDYNVM